MPLTVGDQIGRIVGAPAGSTVMHQNVAIAEAVVLSCFRPTPRAEPGRLRARQLPVGALPLPGAAGPRGRRVRGRRARSWRRSTSARCSSRSATCSSSRARSRTSSGSSSRAHEVGAHVILDAYQSAGIVPLDVTALERRLRRRRLGQVALRRPGQRLALRPPRPRRAARAGLHRLAGARGCRSPSRRRCATRPAPRAS